MVINCIFRAYGGDGLVKMEYGKWHIYFKDCIMEGGVDFLCPRGWAYAENCTFIYYKKLPYGMTISTSSKHFGGVLSPR
jgi:pectin methylesterase-like acyl-CoA thioesterase